jgi:hypothetical protein
MFNIGSRVFASSDFHDVEGVIVRADSELTGKQTDELGHPIETDSLVSILPDGESSCVVVKGWLWSFELITP